MSFHWAIALTIVATSVARIGIVLLKQAVADAAAPGAHGRFQLAAALARSGRGWAGVGLEILGYGLFLFALSGPDSPISILQPMRAFGIIVMAFLSVVFLHERLRTAEWLGIALQTVGMILLGLTPPEGVGNAVSLPRLMAFWAILSLTGAFFAGLLFSSHQERRVEVAYGVLAGILLGLAYLHIKVLFMAYDDGQVGLVVLSALTMPIGAVGGLAVLLWSFRTCRALVVTTINFVINQVVVIVGGAVCLGESFPAEPLLYAGRIAGIGFIFIGVVLLSRFQEARTPTVAANC